MKLALAFVVLPCAAWAAEPLTGAEFDAYTQGKTMTYARDGKIWGREQYLAEGQVIWAFEGEACKHGHWREVEPGLICFSYRDEPFDLECWRFFAGDGQLQALSTEDGAAAPLAAIEETAEPLACPGPDLGV